MTTVVFGEKYQDWIPFIIYSIGRSYPEYDLLLFIGEKLRPDLKPMINELSQHFSQFKIIENAFHLGKHKMTPLKAMSLRWVLWDDSFTTYDYIYYIDSDIIFFREDIPLHTQHIEHMKAIGHPSVSNILRKKKLSVKNWYDIYYNLKNGGILSVLNFLITRNVYRVSGLHFVKVKEYFGKFTKDKIEHYMKRIVDGSLFRGLAYTNDEHALYKMLTKSGIDMNKLAIQRTSSSMFGPWNGQAEFCPHHGLHMGIFRNDSDTYPDWQVEQLESDDYTYYITKYVHDYLTDSIFIKLIRNSSEHIKNKFAKMHKYYGLDNIS